MKWFLKENIIDKKSQNLEDDEITPDLLYRQNDIGRKLSSRKASGIPKGMTVLPPGKILGNTEQELYDNKNEIMQNLNLAIQENFYKSVRNDIDIHNIELLQFDFSLLNSVINFDLIFKNNLEQLFLNILSNNIYDYINNVNLNVKAELFKCKVNFNLGLRRSGFRDNKKIELIYKDKDMTKFIHYFNNNFNFDKFVKELDLKMEKYDYINYQESKINKNTDNNLSQFLYSAQIELIYLKRDKLEKIMQQDYRPKEGVPEDYYAL